MLTVRMTASQRRDIHGYAVDCDLDANDLVLRALLPVMGSWLASRNRLRAWSSVKRGTTAPRLAVDTSETAASGSSPTGADPECTRQAG